MVTGLAAQANNATVLFKLITSIVGESVRPIIYGIPMICRCVTYPLSLDFLAIQQQTNSIARLLWLPIAKHGACMQISASNTLEQIRACAAQIRHALQASKYAPFEV